MRDAQHPSTTRRTVLRTAAWTAPAVAVVAAAPAYAASTTASLVATWGQTGVARYGEVELLVADGLAVETREALPAGTLTLVATFVADSPVVMLANDVLTSWTLLSRTDETAPAVFQYAGALAAGDVVVFEPGGFVAVPVGSEGAFRLVFTAGAASSAPLTLPVRPPV